MNKGYTMILKFVCERGFQVNGNWGIKGQEWYTWELPSGLLAPTIP